MTIEESRAMFPILKDYTYFNTARFCAVPTTVATLQQRYLQSLSLHGSWEFSEWSEKYELTRQLSADMMGSTADQVFFIPNVSTGINLSSLYLPKGRKVVLLDKDFPSVVLPWRSHGFEIESCDYKAANLYEELEAILSQGNKILCMSWVQSADGFEIDLDRIYDLCKRHDAILVLDGTQGFGAIPFKVDPDLSMVFLTSAFKWLLAGYGVALGYVSEDLMPHFKAFQGWNSIDFGTGHAKTGAASLEVGNAMFFNVLSLYEGLSLINEVGMEVIYKKNTTYRTSLINALQNAGHTVDLAEGTRSTIFRVEVPDGKYEELAAAKVQTSKQRGKLRLSPHFYNNEADIDRLIAALN
ncbi:MAG: aminotransferase class V-fold PLP-dependent enzyme [Cytophagales bacterium]|nr:aminotransferase class V-fold PLP-dependent enzyme [Cytophagales bacterium]